MGHESPYKSHWGLGCPVTDVAWSCRAQCDFLKEQLKKSYVGTKGDPPCRPSVWTAAHNQQAPQLGPGTAGGRCASSPRREVCEGKAVLLRRQVHRTQGTPALGSVQRAHGQGTWVQ